MTTAERVELALVPIGAAIAFGLSAFFPDTPSVGTLLLATSVLLLAQGLVRDLFLLASRRPTPAEPTQGTPCLCVESIIGLVGVIAGIGLAFAGWRHSVSFSAQGWALLTLATMTLGFLMKDLVIGWRPWRIRKEKDHLNVVFSWKRQ